MSANIAEKKKILTRKKRTLKSSGQLVVARKSPRVDLTLLAETSRQIATMKESKPLSRDFCEEQRIIYPEMANREVANTFREIRTNLLALSRGDNFITMVTSITPGGGSSFVSLNLATAFAFDDTKTSLLVDCNLRDPSQHKLLNLSIKKGLTDYLEGMDVDIDEIMYPSGIRRLRVIPVGKQRESVSEFFTSVQMRKFLENVQYRYSDRYIVVDAPPIGDSVDARILSELCDFVVIVVDYGRVTESELMSAVETIGPDKLAGVVMNRDPSVFRMNKQSVAAA